MSLSTRGRRILKAALGSTSLGNELADLMGGVVQKSLIQCTDDVVVEVKEVSDFICPAVTGSVKEVSQLVCPAENSKKEITQISCVADASKKENSQLVCPANLPNVKEITQLICPAETSIKEITQFVCPAELSIKEVTQLICVAETSVKEITQLICVAETGAKERTQLIVTADVGGSLNGKYFYLYDADGSVAFWMENGAGAEPAHGANRAVKITTIVNDDLIGTVGTKIYTAIGADNKFTGISDNLGGTIIVGCDIAGVRMNSSAATSGFAVSENAIGVNSNLDGKYFILQDEVGSVGVWFDVDDKGTTIPAGATACARAIEVTTVTTGMAIGALGTALYTKLIADAKFDAHNDDAAGTIQVEASLSGVRAAATNGDSGFTTSSHVTGVVSNYDGLYVKLYDEAGSVGFWFDVDARGTAAPTTGCTRDVEIDTVTNGMVIGDVGTAIYTKIVADAKFDAHNDDAAGTIQVEASLSGARSPAVAGTSPLTPSVHVLGVASNYDGKFVKMYDEVGSVAFWFDLDNRGTAAPTHGCDRAVQIDTLVNGDVAGTVGTAIYAVIDADAKFVGTADNFAGTIKLQASLSGARTASSQQTSPIGVSIDTLGVASNYDGKFVKMYDEVGSVGFWFDVDNRGTTIPAGATACDRALEISTVTNGMAAGAVGTAIYTAIDADLKFVGTADNFAGTIKLESSTIGNKTNSSAETSPITVSVDTAGRTDNYQTLFFKIYDEVGSVGVWFDVDDAGGACPAGALACARQIEMNTITSGMTAGQVGTALYNILDADLKLVGTSDNAAGTITVTSSTYGAKADVTAETSPLTVSVTQQGVNSNYNGTFLKIYDEVGSVAFWFDVDNAGTAAPVHGCDRAVEITTITSAMAIGAAGTAIYTAIDADAKFVGWDDALDGTIQIESSTYGAKTNATAQTSPCAVSVSQQGVTSNYNGMFLRLYDEVGSVGVWFDVDDAGTACPAGATACDRQIEVTTITSEMAAPALGTALYAKIVADAKFEPGVDGGVGTFTVQSSTAGKKADITSQTSPITCSVTQQGTDNYDNLYFKLYDEVGSVGFWFDIDNLGTTIPAGATACDRAVEINTVTSGMTNIQAATAIYQKIIADAKFDAGADAGDGTFNVSASKPNERTDPDMGDSPCIISVSVQGVTSNYDGVYIILGDSAGSIGLWIDVDNAGTAEPAAVAACDRAIEITSITGGMTAQLAMDEIYAALVSDGILTVSECGGASIIIEQDAVGVSDQQPSDFPDVIEVKSINIGKDNGGSMSALLKKAFKNSLCVNNNNIYYLEWVTVIEAGTGTALNATKAKNCRDLLDVMLTDRSSYNEIVALYA